MIVCFSTSIFILLSIIRNLNVQNYNTPSKSDLHLPKPKLCLGKHTFQFSDSVLFNLLPTKIQRKESLSSLRMSE